MLKKINKAQCVAKALGNWKTRKCESNYNPYKLPDGRKSKSTQAEIEDHCHGSTSKFDSILKFILARWLKRAVYGKLEGILVILISLYSEIWNPEEIHRKYTSQSVCLCMHIIGALRFLKSIET
nr:PREDICTED: uncharacterized protein LOC109043534 [Bemisia tabaci]